MVIRGPWESLTGHYILLPDHSVQMVDLLTWAMFFEDHDARRVGEDFVASYRISTVFLGIDHNFFGVRTRGKHVPILFETMIFGPDDDALDLHCRRYATWDEAVAGHRETVAMVARHVAERKNA